MAGNAGGIVSRRTGTNAPRETIRPELKLPFGLRGAEPIFAYMMDMAADTKAITEAYLEATEETNAILSEIRDELKRRPA
jgi:hypothetical protein